MGHTGTGPHGSSNDDNRIYTRSIRDGHYYKDGEQINEMTEMHQQSGEIEKLRAERDAYRLLAVSYAKLARVSEANVDDIVRARLAQKNKQE